MPLPPKKPAAKKELDYWGNPVTAADKKRFKAEAVEAAKPKPMPKKIISAEAKKRAASKQAIGAASKKGLKGRRGNIDRMIDNF
jgi:hypothetical protein